MLRGHTLEADDLPAIAEMLESERKTARMKRGVCFALSALTFLLLVAAFVMLAYAFLDARTGLRSQLPQIGAALATFSAGVLTFFSFGWGAQNCIHMIERSLVAARHGRHKLFATFIEQVQCGDKNKKALLLEWVGVFAG